MFSSVSRAPSLSLSPSVSTLKRRPGHVRDKWEGNTVRYVVQCWLINLNCLSFCAKALNNFTLV